MLERINYLIELYACGNAKLFADKCGIRADSLSRVRNGKGNPEHYLPYILKAFPDVRREWLYTGEGRALHTEVITEIAFEDTSFEKLQ